MKKKQAVIFDIDGTLANIDHRLHHIQQEPKNWDAFQKDCSLDDPIYPLINLAHMFDKLGFHIILCTGRNFQNYEKTAAWLNFHTVPYHRIHMREDGNYESDFIIKKRMLDLILEKYEVFMVFEDRDRVVQMYRENGLTCLQVADGAY